MGIATPITLSGSTDGKPIKVTQTAIGTGDTVHTVGSGIDAVWIYCDNESTSPQLLTIGWGGTTDIDHTIKTTIPPRGNVGDGRVLVIDGEFLKNSLVIKAAAGNANVLKITGHAIRYS